MNSRQLRPWSVGFISERTKAALAAAKTAWSRAGWLSEGRKAYCQGTPSRLGRPAASCSQACGRTPINCRATGAGAGSLGPLARGLNGCGIVSVPTRPAAISESKRGTANSPHHYGHRNRECGGNSPWLPTTYHRPMIRRGQCVEADPPKRHRSRGRHGGNGHVICPMSQHSAAITESLGPCVNARRLMGEGEKHPQPRGPQWQWRMAAKS